MLTRVLKRFARMVIRKQESASPSDDDFLRRARGVIHVGANEGQERGTYQQYGLNVVWVEPDPGVFARLASNISELPRQRAFEALVTDRDGAEYQFHVADNAGLSSSILDLNQHRDIWPQVGFSHDVSLISTTLDTLVENRQVDLRKYNCLVLDTQGSELLVLRGGSKTLSRMKFVKVEVADFDAYSNCCKVEDVGSFLSECGFRESQRTEFAQRASGGSYFDILYEKAV